MAEQLCVTKVTEDLTLLQLVYLCSIPTLLNVSTAWVWMFTLMFIWPKYRSRAAKSHLVWLGWIVTIALASEMLSASLAFTHSGYTFLVNTLIGLSALRGWLFLNAQLPALTEVKSIK